MAGEKVDLYSSREWFSAYFSQLFPLELGEGDKVPMHLFAWGDTKHPKGDFEVTRDFAGKMLESFDKLTADGYRPPVLQEHETDGRVFGVIASLELRDDGIWAIAELARGIKEQIERGERLYISPSFYAKFPHPHTGEVLEVVLREVSLVAVPHMKNLTPLGSHYALSEWGFIHQPLPTEKSMGKNNETTDPKGVVQNDEHGGEGEEKSMMQKLMEKLNAMEQSMDKRMTALEESMATPKGEEPEDNGEGKEMSERYAKLTKRFDALSEKCARMEVETGAIQALGEVGHDDLEVLYKAHIAGPDVYERLLKSMGEERKPAEDNVDLSERGAKGSSHQRANPGSSKSMPFEKACYQLAEEQRKGRELKPFEQYKRLKEIMGLGTMDFDEVYDEPTFTRIVG